MKGMRNIAPFGLRMPDELKEAIAKRAEENGRSMNSEIVQILEDAIEGYEDLIGVPESIGADMHTEGLGVPSSLFPQKKASGIGIPASVTEKLLKEKLLKKLEENQKIMIELKNSMLKNDKDR